MGEQLPFLIGIAGSTCSGKTWLAEWLERSLGKAAGRLSMDAFYLDRGCLSPRRRKLVNFDHPRAIDWACLEGTLERLVSGQAATVPCYDFGSHCRLSQQQVLAPGAIVIMEGLWLFRRRRVRNYFHYRIFLKHSAREREQRRLDRDLLERGRRRADVREEFRRALQMQKEFVDPQERHAHIVIEGTPGRVVLTAILERVKALSQERIK